MLCDGDTGSEGGGFRTAGVYKAGRVLRFADHEIIGVRMGAAASEDGDDCVLGERRAVASCGKVLPCGFEIVDDLLDGFTACICKIRVADFGRVTAQEHSPAQGGDDRHSLGVPASGQIMRSLHEGCGELFGKIAVQYHMGAETGDDMKMSGGYHVVDHIGMAACTVDDHAGLKAADDRAAIFGRNAF